ncbi:MAG: DsbA family oxidoreductase [Tissierella sp.]|uniref:DsbA family oxidoreductase n=1 Tax=Tissierella sp. TaxID=41274 RepID=UPI003F9D3ADA
MQNIKTFMDFTCPFCYIGFSILNRLKNEEPNLEYIWYPYELSKDIPLEGKDISDKFPQGQLEKNFQRIVDLGKEYNLTYNNKNMSYNTGRVHKAALFARDSGKFYEFAKEAFDTVFEKGENIADKEVINNIGLKVGINIAEMNSCIDDGGYDEEMLEAERLSKVYEVESVPTFIVDDKRNVTELKEYREFKKDLEG